MAYDLKSVKAPRLAGLGLRIFANLIEWGFPGKLIIPQLLRDAGVTAFRRKASNEVPTLKPLVEVSVRTSGAASKAELKRIGALKAKPVGFRFPTASDYVSAYKKGRTNPEDVARAALHLLPRRAEPVAGIVAFSGRLLVPERLAAEALSKPPVLLVHGDQDPMVPFADMGVAGRALAEAGFETYGHVMKGTGHGIAPDGLSVALSFLKDRLPGA